MATTENFINGDGTTTQFNFTFPYIKKEDVRIELQQFVIADNTIASTVEVTAFTIPDANPTQVQFNAVSENNYQETTGAPKQYYADTAPNLVRIRIYRVTDTTTTSSTFFPGSAIRAQDLNRNFEQSLFIGQEEANKIQDVISGGIADGSVTTSKIADDAVTAAKLGPDVSFTPADGSITTAKLANNAVTTAKLADANVTTAKLADANVTTAKLADANVTTAKLANNAVTTAKLANGSITPAKLDTSYLPLAGGTMSGDITFANTQTFPSSGGGGFISNSSATFTGNTTASNYTFSIPSNAKRIVINFLLLYRVDANFITLGINIGDSNGLWTTAGQNQVNNSLIYSVADSSLANTGVRLDSDRSIPIGISGSGNNDVNSGTITLFRITDSSNNYFSGTGTTSSAQPNASTAYSSNQSTRNAGQVIVDHIDSTLPVSQFSFVYNEISYGITGYVSIDYYSNI